MRRDRGKKSEKQEESERFRQVFGAWPEPNGDSVGDGEDAASDDAAYAAYVRRQREEAEDFFQNLDSENGYHTQDDIRHHICALSPNDQLRRARSIGESCGPYRELTWLSGKPRIFATDRQRVGVAAEKGARTAIHFLNKIGRGYRAGALIDPSLDTRATAADAAYRNLRPIEQRVLQARLTGKREGDATWEAISNSTDVGSVPITQEIFKVAVTEFLSEYRRLVAAVVADRRDS